MPVSPPPISASPYAAFEQDTQQALVRRVLDYNGVPLYEDELGTLFLGIVEDNDAPMLKQYLTKYPHKNCQADIYIYDPFIRAVACGSVDTLRILLEHYAAWPERSKVIEREPYFLIDTACSHAQVDVVRFLLDSEPVFRHVYPWIGDIHTKSVSGTTPLLLAAISFTLWNTVMDVMCVRDMREQDVCEHVARSEQLVQMLLDKGACARDSTVIKLRLKHSDASMVHVEEFICDTVLSSAISLASPGLIKRLIDEGADVHSKTIRPPFDEPTHLFGEPDWSRSVTPLHIGGYYLNAAGIQVLLDHRGSNIDIVDMVSCRDSRGCLPLHWAASGPDRFEEYYVLSGRDIALQTIITLKLLLEPDPTTINTQNSQGETSLFRATMNHGRMCREKSDILKFLCENGADASLRDRNGQTPLHRVCFHRWSDCPIDTAIIDLFLAYGANLNDTDIDGNTPLHLLAGSLTQVNAVQFLLSRGANVTAENIMGNTPVHETADACYEYYRPGLIKVVSRIPLTADEKISAKDQIIRILMEAGGDENLMDQKNMAGKTPRQLREERNNEWKEVEEAIRQHQAEIRMDSQMGRGRGKPLSS